MIRPAYVSGEPLIEFRGDHRAESFPQVLRILNERLPALIVSGSEPIPDDFIWSCSYKTGEFEVSDDWGGLFILPKSEHGKVVEEIGAALEASGQFRRIDAVAQPFNPADA